MAALVFGIDRIPEEYRECPAWPSNERLEGMRRAAYTRFIRAAIPEAHARGLNVQKGKQGYLILPDGLEVTTDPHTAEGAWCRECGFMERSPYWDPSRTVGIHHHGGAVMVRRAILSR